MRATSAPLSAMSGCVLRRFAGPMVLLVALAALLANPGAAGAASLLDTTVSAAGTLERSCFTRDLSGYPAVEARSVRAPGVSVVQARLEGDAGDDWDVAILDPDSGAVVAASAYRGSSELAEGFALGRERFLVQACRRSGDGDARLSVNTIPIDVSGDVEPPQLVKVPTPTEADKARLQSLGLDVTEHGGEDFLSVVLYGPEDVGRLEAGGFEEYEVLIRNLVAQGERDRTADARFATSIRAAGSALPSGRSTYRRLFHYSEEMKRLADRNPNLVKPITLRHETYEGRTVEGIEITTNPRARDGKPVFLQMGVHHAREWPSGEHAMEWAHELINGYRAGNQRVVNLVRRTRTIIVPIVNPDGFNLSRETGELQNGGNGRDAGSYEQVLTQLVAFGQEYWRKNCRLANDADAGNCSQPGNGIASPGVDPNRNYGGFWGGPGASTVPAEQDYRGPGPFSEPETQNIQDLISHRQVTTLITNHTFSNLVLRPPGQSGEPDTPDEPLYRALGRDMARENGYANIRAYELYDTTGSTEDWSYFSTGGLGFTFEIGCGARIEGTNECDYGNFHGPFQEVVAEYRGTSQAAGSGGGNRAAYFAAQENTANASRHSIIKGRAPGDAVLRLQKTFQTQTWKGEHGSFRDHLETTLNVPQSGRFRWHVNPSTRPFVAQERGRPATGEPSPPFEFSGSPSGPPADGAVPCGDAESTDEGCSNDHGFTVPEGPNIDNARAAVRIDWQSPVSDWDMKVFLDSDGDGSSAGETEEVAQSAQGAPTTAEEASFAEPVLEPGQAYVVRVTNFAAVDPYEGSVTYEGPEDFKPGRTEAWTLTCEQGGRVRSGRQVFVDRGEVASVDVRRACNRRGGGPGGNTPGCRRSDQTISGDASGEVIRGTQGSDVILARAGNDVVRGRGGRDLICAGRGKDRVRGGGGGDRIVGAAGRDNLRGGKGSDRVGGGGKGDLVTGQKGRDALFGAKGRDTLRGGPGKDKLTGGPGKDTRVQ